MEVITAMPAAEAAEKPDGRREVSIEYPLPTAMGACAVIHGFLSRAECGALIAQAEARGFAKAELDYPPSYRDNDRQVLDDTAMADWLFGRLTDAFGDGPERMLHLSPQCAWRLQGVNERLRLCRYTPGQQFRIHQDGVHHRGPLCRSMLTFMVYLTDGDDFEGGDTLFYGAGPSQGDTEQEVITRIRPKAGSLILFDHGIWHAGEAVTAGTKYVLRSDLLFHQMNRDVDDLVTTSRHDGYVWALAALSDGRLASGGRDGTIRIWNPDGLLACSLAGHSRSVLGLIEVSAGIIASISRDRTLRFWETESGHCLRSTIAHKAAALSIARLSNKLIATGGADHSIELWSELGVHQRTLDGHRGWVWSLAALGEDTLASASEDRSIRIWDLPSGRCVAVRHVSDPLRSIDTCRAATTHCVRLLAAGDASGRVTLWTIGQGVPDEAISFRAHGAAVRRVRFLNDGSLATCGEDNRLRVWNLDTVSLNHEEVGANFVTDVIELSGGIRVRCGYDGEIAWN